MDSFHDLLQRVRLLNGQLSVVDHAIGSEARRAVYERLWALVRHLNEHLALELENSALELYADGDRLVIHYWFGTEPPFNSHEVNIFIDSSFGVERHTKELGSGIVTVT